MKKGMKFAIAGVALVLVAILSVGLMPFFILARLSWAASHMSAPNHSFSAIYENGTTDTPVLTRVYADGKSLVRVDNDPSSPGVHTICDYLRGVQTFVDDQGKTIFEMPNMGTVYTNEGALAAFRYPCGWKKVDGVNCHGYRSLFLDKAHHELWYGDECLVRSEFHDDLTRKDNFVRLHTFTKGTTTTRFFVVPSDYKKLNHPQWQRGDGDE